MKKIKHFYKNSLAGKYYATFDINSKNFPHISEETEEWFEHLVDLLAGSTRLTEQGEHQLAIECFILLYEIWAAISLSRYRGRPRTAPRDHGYSCWKA